MPVRLHFLNPLAPAHLADNRDIEKVEKTRASKPAPGTFTIICKGNGLKPTFGSLAALSEQQHKIASQTEIDLGKMQRTVDQELSLGVIKGADTIQGLKKRFGVVPVGENEHKQKEEKAAEAAEATKRAAAQRELEEVMQESSTLSFEQLLAQEKQDQVFQDEFEQQRSSPADGHRKGKRGTPPVSPVSSLPTHVEPSGFLSFEQLLDQEKQGQQGGTPFVCRDIAGESSPTRTGDAGEPGKKPKSRSKKKNKNKKKNAATQPQPQTEVASPSAPADVSLDGSSSSTTPTLNNNVRDAQWGCDLIKELRQRRTEGRDIPTRPTRPTRSTSPRDIPTRSTSPTGPIDPAVAPTPTAGAARPMRAPASSGLSESGLCEGCRVVLTGLSHANLNGRPGRISGILTDKGRWPVALEGDSGQLLSIKPSNLRVRSATTTTTTTTSTGTGTGPKGGYEAAAQSGLPAHDPSDPASYDAAKGVKGRTGLKERSIPVLLAVYLLIVAILCQYVALQSAGLTALAILCWSLWLVG